MRTYPGRLAPISDSIKYPDANPLTAAVREIREETGFDAERERDLNVAFSGKSFSFVDEQAQRSWMIYPFGLALRVDKSKVKIDWERSNWE